MRRCPVGIVGLLEADLLQALPLFVFMGALLNRLPLARILFRTALRPFGGARGATLALGAILGPMNGSVSANAIALTRAIEPALAEHEVPPAESIALLTIASTLGVLVPPSLVLILLGDAMMAAHTIALTATGRADRIINTQGRLSWRHAAGGTVPRAPAWSWRSCAGSAADACLCRHPAKPFWRSLPSASSSGCLSASRSVISTPSKRRRWERSAC